MGIQVTPPPGTGGGGGGASEQSYCGCEYEGDPIPILSATLITGWTVDTPSTSVTVGEDGTFTCTGSLYLLRASAVVSGTDVTTATVNITRSAGAGGETDPTVLSKDPSNAVSECLLVTAGAFHVQVVSVDGSDAQIDFAGIDIIQLA